LCCALAIFETDGRDPTSWVETRDSKLAATRATRSYGACVQLDRSLSVEHRHGGVHSSGDGVGGHRWGQPLHDHRQLDQAVCPTSTRPNLFVLFAASHDAAYATGTELSPTAATCSPRSMPPQARRCTTLPS